MIECILKSTEAIICKFVMILLLCSLSCTSIAFDFDIKISFLTLLSVSLIGLVLINSAIKDKSILYIVIILPIIFTMNGLGNISKPFASISIVIVMILTLFNVLKSELNNFHKQHKI